MADQLKLYGCFTLEKYLRGKTLCEMERILGFHEGRLAGGAKIAAFLRLPAVHEFDLQGYNQVASHRFNQQATKGLDIPHLKQTVLKTTWQLAGPNRIVKVLPAIAHNASLENDFQYPPGTGVPQWYILKSNPIDAEVIATISEYKKQVF